jgi:short-subunit dehydrogenase
VLLSRTCPDHGRFEAVVYGDAERYLAIQRFNKPGEEPLERQTKALGALYAATKHAIEGYSESLDHEVREYGIRVLLVEPAYTRTSFDTNAIPADEPLALYAQRREILDALMADAIKGGDEPSVVGETIVTAATDRRPKLRYPAGNLARRVSKLRRYAPSALFNRQIRKINKLAA